MSDKKSDEKVQAKGIPMPGQEKTEVEAPKAETSMAAETAEKQDAESRVISLETKVNTLVEESKSMFAAILKEVQAKNVKYQIGKDGVFAEDVYEKEDVLNVLVDPLTLEEGRPGLTSVHSAEFKAKAEQMIFDVELIQIMVMPSASTYPDHTFHVGVNGTLRLVVRGMKMVLPRNYVEVLLRAKTSTYGNFEVRNPMTNELEVQNPETKSHRYPLQILRDDNPLGPRWLERVTNDTRA